MPKEILSAARNRISQKLIQIVSTFDFLTRPQFLPRITWPETIDHKEILISRNWARYCRLCARLAQVHLYGLERLVVHANTMAHLIYSSRYILRFFGTSKWHCPLLKFQKLVSVFLRENKSIAYRFRRIIKYVLVLDPFFFLTLFYGW